MTNSEMDDRLLRTQKALQSAADLVAGIGARFSADALVALSAATPDDRDMEFTCLANNCVMAAAELARAMHGLHDAFNKLRQFAAELQARGKGG